MWRVIGLPLVAQVGRLELIELQAGGVTCSGRLALTKLRDGGVNEQY